jgi:hypothetical protein
VAESWRLKLTRAQQHLSDLNIEIDRYAQQHAYEAVRYTGSGKCHEHTNCWRYQLRITKEPDPWLAILTGDVIHNMRSGLDHIAVALAPRSRRYEAKFPIRMTDPWARKGRSYAAHNPETRRSFNTAVKGMSGDAVAVIKQLQPYQPGGAPGTHFLAQLSKLENADKHRQLLAFVPGLSEVTTIAEARGEVLTQSFLTPEHFVKKDAQVSHFGWLGSPSLEESEVNVEVRGTPVVAIKLIEIERGYTPLNFMLQSGIDWIRDEVFPSLERCLNSRSS